MSHRTIARMLGIAALCGAAMASMGLQAQTVYRIVGANGRVTFSDKPPATTEQGKVAGTGLGASVATTASALPFELRQIAAKYPVTLFSAPKCAPCDAGRGLLTARGIPFSERTVTTPEDSDYLQRLSGDTSLPMLNIGSQRIRGFSDSEWTQYLDAAGYPKASALPAAYKNGPPTPLVTVQKPVTPAPKAPEKSDAPSPTPAPASAGNPANPAGITF